MNIVNVSIRHLACIFLGCAFLVRGYANPHNPLLDVGVNLTSKAAVPLKKEGVAAPPQTDLKLNFLGDAPDEGVAKLKAIDGGTRINVYSDSASEVSLPKEWDMVDTTDIFPLTYKIEGIAVSASKDDVKLEFSHAHDGKTKTKSVLITVVDVQFEESAPNAGFDSTITPPALMVPLGAGDSPGLATVKLQVTPADVVSDLKATMTDVSIATCDPEVPTASPQDISVTGVSKGSTELELKMDSALLGKLTIDVKKRVDVSIEIYAVTEENDDVAVGAPGEDLGPNVVCIGNGPNGFLDTVLAKPDDEYVGNTITTGVNGKRDTEPNNTDLVPSHVPTAADLATYLNRVWGKQANVHFTVRRFDMSANYDLNMDGKLDNRIPIGTGGLNDEQIILEQKSAEKRAELHVVSSGDVVRFYYVNAVTVRDANTAYAARVGWIGDAHENSALNITAHEVGHVVANRGSMHSDDDKKELMYKDGIKENPEFIPKRVWDLIVH